MFLYTAQWEYTDEKAAVPANDELFYWDKQQYKH